MSAEVKDVMTTRVVAVKMAASFKEMATRLRQHRVSAFPVVDDEGRVVGVVSEADMLTKEALVASAGLRPDPPARLPHRTEFIKAGAVTAADLMSTPPITISPEEPVTSAARLMYSLKVKRLPVVDDANHLVGIISRADVLSVYSRPDAEIQQVIQDLVKLNHAFVTSDRFNVSVNNGVVTLEGHLTDAGSGQAIVADAWHIEGVVSVRDRFDYPPSHAEEI
jgi:CBS domain-containing protein